MALLQGAPAGPPPARSGSHSGASGAAAHADPYYAHWGAILLLSTGSQQNNNHTQYHMAAGLGLDPAALARDTEALAPDGRTCSPAATH